MSKKVFLTTSIPYVNGEPHIGHSLEFIQTDVLARYYRDKYGKDEVRFLSGTDENALKNVLAAENAKVSTKEYVDEKSNSFAELAEILDISFDDFIRTTEDRHVKGAQKLWEALDKNDIYEDTYSGLYCVGCEEFKTGEELVDGLCPEHKKAPEEVTEKNYFFKLSRYQDEILSLIKNDVIKIVPEKRKNEVLGFLRAGLHDFSISRSVARAKGWGIKVPNDSEQIIYVWIDALSNYITALGYANDDQLYKDFWVNCDKKVHVIGKGIVKFHALYWIGMLLSAKLPLPTEEFVHGYVTVEGNKIGKSLGNAIHPKEVVTKYGRDAFRYYALREIPAYGDGDFSWERMKQLYEADLQNGLGNLVSRVAAMANGITLDETKVNKISEEIAEKIENYQFDEALKNIWEKVKICNARISEKEVWKLEMTERKVEIERLVSDIRQIACDLKPFLPESAEKIAEQYQSAQIAKSSPLFPRLNKE